MLQDAVAEAAIVRAHIHLVAVARHAGVEARPAIPRFAVVVEAVARTHVRVPDHHAVVRGRKESSHQPINQSDSFDWSFH